MNKIFGFLFLLLSSIALGQNTVIIPALLHSEKIDADYYYGTDQFGAIYYVKDDVVFKKNNNQIWQYKNLRLGTITKIDIQNPLKIVVFYEKFNTIIQLDNQLNEVQKTDFNQYSLPIIAAATGMASQNRLWIFNATNKQLGLYDFQKNSYTSLSQPFKDSIRFYQTNYNYFYWITPQLELYACDVFGKIIYLGTVPPFDNGFLYQNNLFFYTKDSFLYGFDLNKQETLTIDIAEKSYGDFSIKEQILSIFTSKEIFNFKITNP